MELRTLKYFVTVAEELNITRAAELLNMSQPPLSSQIKNLEDELGTQLFIRGHRQLELTESGELLYNNAKEILRLTEKANAEILGLSKGITGTISIGLVEGMAPDIAAEWIADFIKQYPGVRFRILDGNSDDLIEKMRSGLISLAVIASPIDQVMLNSIHVGGERVAAFINKSHPLAAVSSDLIRLEDLVDEPLILPSRKDSVNIIYKWFRENKIKPNVICEMDSYLDATALAARGVGISIFPQTAYVPNDQIVSKLIEGSDRTVEYFFVWKKGRMLPSPEEAFIDYIINKYPII